MNHLLLLEDDQALGETLKERLEVEGYKVTWVKTCHAAIKEFSALHINLAVLDVGLPDGSGFDVARELRRTSQVPLVFMTAMNSAENRLEGYEIGAEEFIPKPFHLKELLLRLSHVLENHSRNKVLKIGDVEIDFESLVVSKNGKEQERMQVRDARLLQLLIREAPKVVSRDKILNEIWGEEQFPSHRTVDNSVVRLRSLMSEAGVDLIQSVRGVGYQWNLLAKKGEI
jgi:two-component system, OmpR family, phosphate regulon response regulator PhoB